jgi:S-formylglutathione hydrolase FrmB
VLRSVLLPRPAYTDAHGATVVKYRLDSKVLGRSISEVAVIPKGGGRRPLLILLHGRHDPRPWKLLIPSLSGLESELSNALFAAIERLGKRAPVVVLLNGGAHSYYHDRAAGRFGTSILTEAIPDAVRRFSTENGRVAIGGISMGGYGALHLAESGARQFCAVGGHSAALWEQSDDSAPGAFDDAADFDRNDVVRPAARAHLDRVPVWIDAGADDPFRAADTAFARLLRQHGSKVRFQISPGAHTRSYWNAHMGGYLRFYASALANCPV